MRIALDTNRYVDLCRGVDETLEILEHAEEILMPFVVLAKLRARLSPNVTWWVCSTGSYCANISCNPSSTSLSVVDDNAPRRFTNR